MKRKVNRERTFVLNESEKKASWRTRKKLLGCLRMCVYKKPQSETGNKRLREPHKTRSAKRTSTAEQKREQRTHAAPKNSSSLSSLARGYKDGLQPESLADGNWLVKQYQPVSKIETKSDTNLRNLNES